MKDQAKDELQRSSWRMALQTGALLVLLLVAIAGSVLLIVSTSQATAAQRLLTTATEHVDSIVDAPAGTWLAISNQGVLTVSPGMPSGLPDLKAIEAVAANGVAAQEDVSIGGRSYTVRTAGSGSRVVQAVFDRHENLEELNRLGLALLLTCGGAVVLASLLAVWLARRAMRPMAEALDRQRRFVADASHELRTPLTLLNMRAQMLRRRVASAPTQEPPLSIEADLDAMIEDSRSLTRLLEDLLISADSRRVELTHVDVVALAEDVVQSFSASAARRGVTVVRSGIAGPMGITAAPTALRRLFVALLDNAVRFAKGRVDVGLTRDSRTLVITVRDDGPGFADDVKMRAFERFATAEPLDTKPEEDTVRPRHYGLGLALVAEVAAQHGGRVEIGAQPSGAAVVVHLPIRRNPGNPPAAGSLFRSLVSRLRRMF
ncbi:sensor histidine kinase [Arthrobacter bambusae]|uniref:sensor histidine kinase n=1 Tax=Arthrobacter bambusae TaxID=1338426 RepID=UPI0027830F2E|nr:HAMP domain-containing sensor histidine kinase [Arthrobacter bambusae]MDQ0031706.1 signal transduction histidine kinase [Arthrobacter bambusae]MDQ0098753.1 signal transduction histidine kinase [Arthrobacter bambusae]